MVLRACRQHLERRDHLPVWERQSEVAPRGVVMIGTSHTPDRRSIARPAGGGPRPGVTAPRSPAACALRGAAWPPGDAPGRLDDALNRDGRARLPGYRPPPQRHRVHRDAADHADRVLGAAGGHRLPPTAGLTTALAIILALLVFAERRGSTSSVERIELFRAELRPADPDEESFGQRIARPVAPGIGGAVVGLLPTSIVRRIDASLVTAGRPMTTRCPRSPRWPPPGRLSLSGRSA